MGPMLTVVASVSGGYGDLQRRGNMGLYRAPTGFGEAARYVQLLSLGEEEESGGGAPWHTQSIDRLVAPTLERRRSTKEG